MGKTSSQMPEVQGGGQGAKRHRHDGAAVGPRSATAKLWYNDLHCLLEIQPLSVELTPVKEHVRKNEL
jgi:hypothetical protein